MWSVGSAHTGGIQNGRIREDSTKSSAHVHDLDDGRAEYAARDVRLHSCRLRNGRRDHETGHRRATLSAERTCTRADPAPLVEKIEAKLRDEAGKLGADAVVVVYDRVQPTAAYVSGPVWDRSIQAVTGRKVVGVAIKYRA